MYTFGGFEVFGSRKVPKEKLLALVGDGLPAPGTRLDESVDFGKLLGESKKRLTSAHSFAQCTYSVGVDLETNILRLTVDLVDEGDEWRMRFSPAPQGDVADPEGLIAAWGDFLTAYWKLRNAGALPSGFGSCRAFSCFGRFDHPELAPLEPRFVEGVPRNFDALVRVLREDRDEGKRMSAVNLLAYGPSREQVLQALLPSVRDPAQGVRNEVLRVFGAMQKDQPRVIIPLEKVLEALWFPTTPDRNKAAWALVRILETEGAIHREQILEKAGEPLLEMVAMQVRTDREPAHKVLTLLAGRDLGEDGEVWRQWAQTVAQIARPKAR
ncbi:HEAT repeat domain-containing protein [Vitiosangium sp. GDMCC 1.1324]|uniref:HEAT repeat domain-containing protein n=1 Tax=Vitiosangium sp. (strain GDMCC 1.1324) TaxID=2138576 RepID=UPI000D350F35|nr:HEAT repeat domain-containing protein [Vitiosangium sp. GDMCC 1.1324]PTL77916.1 hypothetical protein DAT35_42730 [Vitiosangium sp. GDMCC 1.1324]